MWSRKCECSFRLCGYLLKSNEWSLSIVGRVHNHMMKSKLGHIIVGSLNEDENEFVAELQRISCN
jgi:hypothetical protein